MRLFTLSLVSLLMLAFVPTPALAGETVRHCKAHGPGWTSTTTGGTCRQALAIVIAINKRIDRGELYDGVYFEVRTTQRLWGCKYRVGKRGWCRPRITDDSPSYPLYQWKAR